VIRLLSLLFSVVCLAVFVWLGVTVDLGERTFFGHLRAIASSRESEALWEGTKAKLRDLVGVEAAQEAARKADAAKKAARDATRSFVEKGGARSFLEPTGPPQEKLTERDQRQMNDHIQKLSGDAKKRGTEEAKRAAPSRPAAPGVQGRSAPRESEKTRTHDPRPN
jgi:hypothetical protein